MFANLMSWRLWDKTHAVANARVASTELSRSRIEREEVELYLARHLDASARALPA